MDPKPNSPEDVGFLPPSKLGPPVAKCRSCGAAIYWATTGTGRQMPVDVKPVENGNVALTWNGKRISAVYVAGAAHPGVLRLSHFATCPNAKQHRKR